MSNLPAGWVTAQLHELISSDGIFCDGDWIESKDQDSNGEFRLIQLADIGDGVFLDRSSRFVNSAKFAALRCTELLPGDVLVARMPDPLGRACLLPRLERRCITVVDVAVLRPGKLGVLGKWLMHFINAPQIREAIQRKRTERSELVCPVGGGRLGPAEHPVEHFTLRVANDR
jgi:type I restriction enzyme S subunit